MHKNVARAGDLSYYLLQFWNECTKMWSDSESPILAMPYYYYALWEVMTSTVGGRHWLLRDCEQKAPGAASRLAGNNCMYAAAAGGRRETEVTDSRQRRKKGVEQGTRVKKDVFDQTERYWRSV